MRVRFLFIAEGSSDLNLAAHIESLFIEQGAQEASAVKIDFTQLKNPPGRSIKEKVDAAIKLEPNIDAIVIHRDADAIGTEAREKEISEQTSHISNHYKIIPFIPKREMESWLILDEYKIKKAVENSKSKRDLQLPTPLTVESISHPKEFLEEKLIEASELKGRKLDAFKRKINQKRAFLAQNLQVDDIVSQVPSHSRLRDKILEMLQHQNQ